MDFARFSARLRALRRECRLTQGALAEFLGVTTNHYQKIEYGQVNISISALGALADHFGVSADYLLGRSDRREG